MTEVLLISGFISLVYLILLATALIRATVFLKAVACAVKDLEEIAEERLK